MVAAWIKAETGVGPSIAENNQICRPIWEDLALIAIIKNNNNNSKIKTKFNEKYGIKEKIKKKSKLCVKKKIKQ